jgi:hypothetical protein
MQYLRWDEVKEWFDPYENGSVPDLVVAGTSRADWAALLTLVRSRGWRGDYEVGDDRGEVPASAADLFTADPKGALRSLRVWPDPDIEIVFRPWSPDEIVGDVSLFEVQGQERLDVFCGILRLLGLALDKRVALYAEGDGGYPPILAYDVDQDRVVFLAGPWGT